MKLFHGTSGIFRIEANYKKGTVCKKIITCILIVTLLLPITACQKQAVDKTFETETINYNDMKCILISEASKELTFDEVVEQKQKVLNEPDNQIVDILLGKENQIRSELDENGKNGQDAIIHYYLSNGTFAYSGNEDYRINLYAVITVVEVPNEKNYIDSVSELYSTVVEGKHNAVWHAAASSSTISIYKDSVRLAVSGFFDIFEDYNFEEPGFSLCAREPAITLTSETLNPVLIFELPK
ncbi:MAG: hypothetical protein ACLUFH_00710 [Monoglobales bacterium]